MIKTPTYHVMNMYKVHQDAMLLPSKIENNAQYRGLPTISVSASKDADNTVHISLVNIDSQAEKAVEVNVADLDIKNIKAQILTSEKLQDHNSFNNPEKVVPGEFKDFKLRKGVLTIQVPVHSLIVLEGK